MNPEICFPKPSFIPSSLSSLRMIYRAKMVCHIHFFSCVAFLLHNITQTTFPTESSINRSLWIAIKHSLQRVLLSQSLCVRGKRTHLELFRICRFFRVEEFKWSGTYAEIIYDQQTRRGGRLHFPKGGVVQKTHSCSSAAMVRRERRILVRNVSHPHTLESDCWGKTKCFCLLCMRRQNEEKRKKKAGKRSSLMCVCWLWKVSFPALWGLFLRGKCIKTAWKCRFYLPPSWEHMWKCEFWVNFPLFFVTQQKAQKKFKFHSF